LQVPHLYANSMVFTLNSRNISISNEGIHGGTTLSKLEFAVASRPRQVRGILYRRRPAIDYLDPLTQPRPHDVADLELATRPSPTELREREPRQDKVRLSFMLDPHPFLNHGSATNQ
jgi:hypothetical protein